ncbi:MAG: PilZ domain-containing protein [Syntrophales bacterium]|nr:PilZ domain-containing protein [Syntrophales bacterium]
MMDRKNLRPGQQADVVVKVDETAEIIDVRQTLLYDVVGDRIVFAQTSRPLSERHLGSKLLITVIERGQQKPVRYGFSARVVDILKDYQLASMESVEAIEADLEGAPAEFNLRMHFRVTPTLDSGLYLSLEGEKVSIMDISLGGARILLQDQYDYNPGALIKASLTIDGTNHNLEVRVLRIWQEVSAVSSRRSDARWFMTVKFNHMEKETERRLSAKVMKIERILRQRELDPRSDAVTGASEGPPPEPGF